MKRFGMVLAGLAAVCAAPSLAASGGVADRMYVLDCGWAHAADKSRWSPGIDVGVQVDVSDNCYLIHNPQGGYILWDTGVAENIADMPDGLSQGGGAVVWHKPKKLSAQLAGLKVKPDDIKYVAISHMHPDHSSNVDMFPKATLLIQKPEWDAIFAASNPPFTKEHPATQLSGDKDVFGDGSVTLISTPGHTPGHQSLVVHLAKTGWLVLSGDAVHFQSNWDNRRVPGMNFDKEKTVTSMNRLAEVIAAHKAELWINHDKAQSDKIKHAPAFYD
ncbi:MAG: N-acyl homoserine lactonase family protein [Rhodospirillaceae bacterium]